MREIITIFVYLNILMEKIFFELGEKPSKDVIKEIARQTAIINNLEIKPDFIYDTWAIVNFEDEYKEKRK